MKWDRLPSWISDHLRAKGSRAKTVTVLAALLLYILILPAFLLDKSSQRELLASQRRFAEFSQLRSEYRSLKERSDSLEQRISLRRMDGVTNALNEIFSSLGLGGKIRSVKVIGQREVAEGLREERAEVQIEKANLNELVNLLYRMRQAQVMLAAKKITIKKTFENPDLLDVSLTVALFTRK